MRPLPSLLAFLLVVNAAVGRAQQCDEDHYRWAAKTARGLRDSSVHRTTVDSMLAWTPLPLFRPAIGHPDCTARSSRELRVYEVTGWAHVWKIESGPHGDLDWHIELTAEATSDITRCIVVEIPDARYGAVFDSARQDFLKLLGPATIGRGKIGAPVRVTVIGPAFFDGQHRGARATGGPPSGHGNCNASSSALWEIHPVFRVLSAAPHPPR